MSTAAPGAPATVPAAAGPATAAADAPAGSTGAALHGRAALRVEHLRALYAQTPVLLVGNGIGLALVLAMFGRLAPPGLLLGWAAVVALLLAARGAHYLRYRSRPDADAERLLGWRASWAALALAQGGCWGAAAWLFWHVGEPFHQLALVLIATSYALGSVQLLASQPAVFLGFISLALLPTIARIATDVEQPYHWELAGIVMLLFGLTWLMGRSHRHALDQAVMLKVRTDQLADQLRRETAAADAARRVADAANRAKTQFFAAASHDLRQPLHAMGLFAEALRQRSRDPEVASLVNSINESVDALEGLFGELLDITRIDTGGVDVNPQPVRMRDLFQRLRLHFEPIAFEKGLVLNLRGERHIAQADPVLLERILRNLVSNAIRYTEDGGVLVTCRPHGARLRLQVWDTGIGIAEASLPRIFDEFYQVHSHRPLQAHHRKGLGLGLAIVKRLAGLMEAPLTVRSVPGRGTVFTLELPAGREPRPLAADARRPNAPIGLTLDGRFFVVVEDEPAVRDGLVVLLQAWGAEVLAFEGLVDAAAWAASAAPRRPDLLLVDYRLPEGATGIEALRALRAAFVPMRVPAIVITGSTMGGHEAEAADHDFHLLIKPVLPNKLRAMIAFKLGVR